MPVILKKIKMKKEYILCAAIYYENDFEIMQGPFPFPTGWVLCGLSHLQIMELYTSMTGKLTSEFNTKGFLTSKNNFVSREKAAQIAFDVGQTKEKKYQLFSDDLY